MVSTLSMRLASRQATHSIQEAAVLERERRALENHLNFVVDSDIRTFWLPRLVGAQKGEHAPVTVNNKKDSGWREKNGEILYLKALNHLLGKSYEARTKYTRFLLRPYIEVTYSPRT